MAKKKEKRTGKTKKLHPASLKKLVDRVYKNPKLKTKVIVELQRLGLCGFAEKNFKLIKRQKKELDTIRDKDCEIVFTNAVAAALNRNGPIELVHEGHTTPNLMINFYATPNEVGVRISC